jgi:hypothetical protein
MRELAPVKPQRLVDYFNKHGFTGPYRVEKHRFMIKGELRLRLPATAEEELIGVPMMRRILTIAGIKLDQ